jgi:hypothetical protein
MSRVGEHRQYDLSGELHRSTLEVMAFNVLELIRLDGEEFGRPIKTPHGAEHFVNVAIMYLTQLRRQRRQDAAQREQGVQEPIAGS